MTPIVAIVGRPNVGKSTLFNRLVGRKQAIVHDAPGVTRDRHYANTHVQGRDIVLIDTGGFDPKSDDPMGQGIARHVRAAITEADVVLCILDGLTPPTNADEQAVKLLRQSDKPCLFVANRIDGSAQAALSFELYRLGLEHIFTLSALHGRGMAELETALVEALPKVAPTEKEQPERQIPRVAFIGRPNAGKSSLLNRLAGSERSLVDARPGTTRDPVDVEVEVAGKRYLLIDTAGIRRKSKIEEEVELASVMQAIRTIDRADIVLLMCDIAAGVSEQDQRLLGLCAERGRAIVVGLNKCDLLTRSERLKQVEAAEGALHFARWAKVALISAKSGFGIDELMQTIWRVHQQFNQRISTSQLNRFFEEVLERHAPPTDGGKAPRLYYITQAEVGPPVFVAMCNSPKSIKESYKRFVANQIRKTFGFDSVPVIVRYRERRRRNLAGG
jgi:GTP-binding protein